MDTREAVCEQTEVKAEVLVIGGGLAGAATAISLAHGGRDVVLVEREAHAEHKVCGEFLSQEALIYLRSLGVDVEALGAVPITAVRFAGGRESQLPFAAVSLTRRRLDEDLLRLAVEAGVRVVRGRSVQALEAEAGGWRAALDGENSRSIKAAAVFLATGKHDLRGRPRPAGRQNNLVAFKMYWRLIPAQAAALDGQVELILYRGGYAGLQPVEDGAANLCCLIERAELQRLDGRWEKLLAAILMQSSHLRERLEGAEALLEKPLAVSAIPYGMMRERTDGVWCLGDQAAVIPSFTGDGMSIALHTGLLAAEMYLSGGTAENFQRRVHAQLSKQVGLATGLSRGLVAQPTLLRVASGIWPGVLKMVATHTRIMPDAMLRR